MVNYKYSKAIRLCEIRKGLSMVNKFIELQEFRCGKMVINTSEISNIQAHEIWFGTHNKQFISIVLRNGKEILVERIRYLKDWDNPNTHEKELLDAYKKLKSELLEADIDITNINFVN